MKERADTQSQLGKIFSKEFDDSTFWPYNKYETEMVKVLTEVFQDTETKWISYYIYELDFGRNWKPMTVTEKDSNGNDIDVPMGTPQQLYKVLTDNIKNTQ